MEGKTMNQELLQHLPVLEVITDDDYRSVWLPCYPFPDSEEPLAELVAEGTEQLEAA